MEKYFAEYPALVYKNCKNNVFVANCICKKIVGFGKTEYDALMNLEILLNRQSGEYPVKVVAKHMLLNLN